MNSETTPTDSSSTIKKSPVGSRFKRLIALIIDVIVLGIGGFVLSLILGDLFFALGNFAWIVGFLITLVYKSVLESSMWKGQTLGKKIFGLMVVDLKGSYLDLPQALKRNSILLLAFYTDDILKLVPQDLLLNSNFMVISFLVIVLLALGVVVFVVFHPLRRGLHDFVGGSIVVQKSMFENETEKKSLLSHRVSMKTPFIISSIIMAFILLSSVVFLIINPFNIPLFKNLVASYKDLNTIEGVQITSVNTRFVVNPDSKTQSESLIIIARVDKNTFQDDEKLRETDRKIREKVATLSPQVDMTNIIVTFETGYDIGIWSTRFTKSLEASNILKMFEQNQQLQLPNSQIPYQQ